MGERLSPTLNMLSVSLLKANGAKSVNGLNYKKSANRVNSVYLRLNRMVAAVLLQRGCQSSAVTAL